MYSYYCTFLSFFVKFFFFFTLHFRFSFFCVLSGFMSFEGFHKQNFSFVTSILKKVFFFFFFFCFLTFDFLGVELLTDKKRKKTFQFFKF